MAFNLTGVVKFENKILCPASNVYCIETITDFRYNSARHLCQLNPWSHEKNSDKFNGIHYQI